MEHSVFRIELVALQIAYAYKGTRKKRKECAGNADAAKICMRIHKLFFYLRTKL